MIRVLHLLPGITSIFGDFNVVMNYYSHIDRNEIQFDFGYIKDTEPNNKKEIESLGGEFFKLTKPSILKREGQFVLELKNILKSKKYDIVHLHMPIFHRFVKKAIKDFNVKLIVHSHAIRLSNTALKRLRNRILTIGLNKNLDYRFACSKMAGKKIFGKSFLNNSKDIVLKNAINFDKFAFNEQCRKEVREKLGLNDNEIAICHVGRFVKEKNHKFLINLFNEMVKQNENMKLYLIGKGELLDKVKQQVKNMNLDDKVKFMGSRGDVATLLNGMDIFILPSKFEGFGIALLEAQISGLICFAPSNIPEEIVITNNIHFFSLKTSYDVLSQQIFQKYNAFNRKPEDMSGSEYNINNASNKLLNIYKEIINA